MRDFFHTRYKTKSSPNTVPRKHAHLWHTIKLTTIGLTCISTLGLLFLHPFFQIQAVNIQGLQRINEADIHDTVNGILSYKRFFLFPQNNFFVVNIDDLHSILEQKFALKKLTISKKFPHTLNLTLEEKLSSILYDNGEQYSMIDANGKITEILRIVDDSEWRVVKKLVTSTSENGVQVSTEQIISKFHTPNYKKIMTEVGEYPLVYDTRNKKIQKGERILDENTVQEIIEWYENLKQNTDIPLTYFYLDQEVGDVTIKTDEGWYIKAKLDDTIAEQFQTLQYILKEKVKRPEIQYIDVRFSGRAFWL